MQYMVQNLTFRKVPRTNCGWWAFLTTWAEVFERTWSTEI